MPTIITQSMLVREAIVYIDSRLKENTGKKIYELLDEAGMRFNLSPAEARDLERIFMENECKDGSGS